MAGELSLFRSDGPSRREELAAGREISRLQAQSRVGLARIDQGSALHAARADGVAEVAGAAMDAVARVSLRGEQLMQIVPSATGRITAIADALTIAQIGLIHDAARRIR